MSRPLVLGLFVGALALGGVAAGRLVGPWLSSAGTAALEDHGVLEVGSASVHFTLYWPADGADELRELVIFAADAHAAHPRPLREWARAAATSGVAAAYLEASDAPEEAAARLKEVLARHAEKIGMDGATVWTWAEGGRMQGPRPAPSSPCGRRHGLAAVVAGAERELMVAGAALQRVLEASAARARCPLAGLP